jgi:L-phenylalanine/L-methionine N-acetyltransferase
MAMTDEITIRHVEPDDYEALNRIILGPRAIWGTMVLPWTSVESSRKLVTSMNEGQYWLVAVVQGEIVGSIAVYMQTAPRRRHVASLSIAVRDDFQGQGVGSALMQAMLNLADNWLNIVRLELVTWTDNEAALALYKKAGFVIEGTHRCYVFRDGQYVDAYALGRIRPDG